MKNIVPELKSDLSLFEKILLFAGMDRATQQHNLEQYTKDTDTTPAHVLSAIITTLYNDDGHFVTKDGYAALAETYTNGYRFVTLKFINKPTETKSNPDTP